MHGPVGRCEVPNRVTNLLFANAVRSPSARVLRFCLIAEAATTTGFEHVHRHCSTVVAYA
eukprot:8462546-Pyramimonas_sp.AAC.1